MTQEADPAGTEGAYGRTRKKTRSGANQKQAMRDEGVAWLRLTAGIEMKCQANFDEIGSRDDKRKYEKQNNICPKNLKDGQRRGLTGSRGTEGNEGLKGKGLCDMNKLGYPVSGPMKCATLLRGLDLERDWILKKQISRSRRLLR